MVEGFAESALGKDPTDVGRDYMQKASTTVSSQFESDKLEKEAAKYMERQRDNLDDIFDDVSKEDTEKNKDNQ